MFHIGTIGDTKAFIDIGGQCKTFLKSLLIGPNCVVLLSISYTELRGGHQHVSFIFIVALSNFKKCIKA